LHLYLGTFFAPSIIFFALTGALQLFGLHESRPGNPYQPPKWLVKLGSLHKNQTLADKRPSPRDLAGAQKRPQSDEMRGPAPAERRRDGKRPESKFTPALKWFFLATSIGLVFTTLLGVYMAFKFNRSRVLIWSLLGAGTAVPGGLVALMA
jgi:hypothetical protein